MKLFSESLLGLGCADCRVGHWTWRCLVQGAIRPARTIGVQVVSATDGRNRPIPTVIYYPARGRSEADLAGPDASHAGQGAPVTAGQHPLILISHGTAGSPTSHLDTALALAEQGFIVAAIIHNGDNYRDQSSVGATNWISDRAHEVVRVTDYMLGGGTACPRSIQSASDCLDSPRAPQPRSQILALRRISGLLRGLPGPTRVRLSIVVARHGAFQSAQQDVHDGRIKAALIAAPGFGMAFTPDGFRQ